MTCCGLRSEERIAWERDGFFVRRQLVGSGDTNGMLEACVELVRAAGGAPEHEGVLLQGEANLRDRPLSQSGALEERAAKLFRLHRREPFRAFLCGAPVLGVLQDLIGPEVDCFLSQFIFKNPGAWGQPWHQDALYFPFDREPQVGLWLAITDATEENGPLHVLPGSHREPLQRHVRDRRPGANYGYLEIESVDPAGERTLMMRAGDLLVFHSLLMHRSTDNRSAGIRAAMVYHCAARGTRDPSRSPVHDWMPLPGARSA